VLEERDQADLEPEGPPGPSGSTVLSGTGAPAWVANGDFYLDTDGTVLGIFPCRPQPARGGLRRRQHLVANSASNDVTKLRASDGTVLGTFAVGYDP